MKALRQLLSNKLVTIPLTAVLLILFFIFVAPFIGFGAARPFAGFWTRLIICLLIGLISATLIFLDIRKRKKKNAETVAALNQPDPTGEAISAETAELRRKFSEAMKTLEGFRFKDTKGRKRYLYELPWYVFIGPPGSGKTTALANCGLEFPLRRGERIDLAGIAGTKNCDWIFANDAVFIDTAGRFTLQDSQRDIDSAGWLSFLKLLKKNRPAEPVNGILLAVSVNDLASGSAEEIDRQATTIRDRLSEVTRELGVCVPVYVLFTKTDMLRGFSEFFSGLEKHEREQVWGVTFPSADETTTQADQELAYNLERIGGHFDDMLDRLPAVQLKRLETERDQVNRTRIFSFPAQLASLRPVVERFLKTTFEPDRRAGDFQFRGFYFTSAVQLGQPIDRLVASLSHKFGFEDRAAVPLSQGARAYFLSDLLKRVIFPEAGLVRRAGKSRGSALRMAGLAAAVVLPVLVGSLFLSGYLKNRAEARELQGSMDQYTQEILPVPSIINSDDMSEVIGALYHLKAARDDLQERGGPVLGGLGTGRHASLRREAERAYDKALDDLVRPRLMLALDDQLARTETPERAFELLKAYLMVAGRGTFDEGFMNSLLVETGPGAINLSPAAAAPHVEAFVEAMAEGRLTWQPPLGQIVIEARDKAGTLTAGQMALAILERDYAEEAPWRLDSRDLRNADEYFIRGGRPLSDPIPLLYTYEGYHGLFLPGREAAVKQAAEDQWVLAETEGAPVPSDSQIERELIDAYTDKYRLYWRALLDEVKIRPFGRNVDEARQTLSALGSTNSPLKRYLNEVARQTRLDVVPDENDERIGKLREIGSRKILMRLPNSMREGINAVKGNGQGASSSPDYPGAAAISASFENLHTFTDPEIGDLGRLLEMLEKRSRAIDPTGGGSGGAPGEEAREKQRLLDIAARGGDALQSMMSDMLSSADSAVGPVRRERLASVFASQVVSDCRSVVAGHYPFGRGSDALWGDVTAFLGPNGSLLNFQTSRLSGQVETGTTPWSWRGGQAMAPSPATLTFLERSQEIREVLFPVRPHKVSIRVNAPGEVSVVSVRLGGKMVAIAGSGAPGESLPWPGDNPNDGIRIEIVTAGSDQPIVVERRGVWGLLRLLHGAGASHSGATWQWRDSQSGVVIIFDFDSTRNPVAERGRLRGLSCPQGW